MPSFTHAHPKKRRRDEDDLDGDILLSLPQEHEQQPQRHQSQHYAASPRKIIPFSSPFSKKIRLNNPSDEQEQQQLQQPYQHTHLSPPHYPRLPAKQLSPPKTINLSPCHICYRRPTKKSDLDSYADCESCGKRTCYICIRQCLGQRGTPVSATYEHHEDLMRDEDHVEYTEDDNDEENRTPSGLEQPLCIDDAPSRQEKRDDMELRTKHGGTWDRGRGRGHWGRICSQCCVERGPQGEVVCLGCLET